MRQFTAEELQHISAVVNQPKQKFVVEHYDADDETVVAHYMQFVGDRGGMAFYIHVRDSIEGVKSRIVRYINSARGLRNDEPIADVIDMEQSVPSSLILN